MILSTERDSLAALEFERHRPQMLYAEKQLLKKGEYEALARGLVKRSRLRLFASVAAAAAIALSGHWSYIALGGAILFAALLDHSHTQRTLTTIRALQGEGQPNTPVTKPG